MVEQPAEFRVGRVIGRTCLVFARSFIKFSPVTVIAGLPSLLIFPNPRSPIVDLHLPVLATFQLLVSTMLFSQAIIVLCVFDGLHGKPVGLVAGTATSLRRFFPIAGLSLGVGVLTGVFAGLTTLLARNPISASAAISMVFILAGVGLFLIWFLATPACVVERLDPFQSLGRSRSLTKGHRLKMFLLILLAVVIGLILFAIAGVTVGVIVGIARVVAPRILADQTILILAVIEAWLAALSAFLGILLAVTYRDLRLTKEGIYTDRIANIFE